MIGTVWDIDRVVKIVDGDTIHVWRSTVSKLGDDWYRIADTQPDGTPRTVSLRLTWVDTPERGKPGWAEARQDHTFWVESIAVHPIRAVCYESAGWDRILADVIDVNGSSVSQWLMRDRNWPAYSEGK